MKRPAFQFYPADWRKDVELRSCSIAARGLWIDMMCIAHECEPYGHLTINGKPMTSAKLAGQVGLTATQCKALLDELIENGVARVNSEGVIYSKRMVEDEGVRNRRAEGGKAGSEHGIKGAEHGRKGGRPRKETGDQKTPLKTPLRANEEPPPSSSSSSSNSSVTDVTDAAGAASPPPPPPDMTDSEARKRNAWAGAKSLLNAHGMPKAQTGTFLGKLATDYGGDVLVGVMESAIVARPAEPDAWMRAACQRASGRRATPNRQEAIESRNQAALEAWLASDNGGPHASQ